MADASGKRFSGFTSSARFTTLASDVGTWGAALESGVYLPSRIFAKISPAVLPWKGRVPVSAS